MTFKQVAFKRPASQEQPDVQDPTSNNPEDEASEGPQGAAVDEREPVDADVSSVISDEVLRQRIRTLIEEKPRASAFRSILSHPLLIVAASVLLTGFIGSRLTHNYSLQQQELASQRSFSDELNKIRVQKIGEVWELVDKNGTTLDDLLDKARNGDVPAGEKTQNVDAILSLIKEDRAVISKNRFWLGEQNYNRLLDYLEKNKRTALNMLLAHPTADLNAIIEERKNANREDILQVKEDMLKEGRPRK